MIRIIALLILFVSTNSSAEQASNLTKQPLSSLPVISGPQYTSDGNYTISWTKPSFFEYSILEQKIENLDWVQIYQGDSYSKNFKTMQGGLYKYRVKICSIFGRWIPFIDNCSSWSRTHTLTVANIVSDRGRTITTDFSMYSSGVDDNDNDGLLDKWELLVANYTRPYLSLDEEEDLHRHRDHSVVDFVKVSRHRCNHIVVTHALTWSKDYGRFDIRAHNGDIEQVSMLWKIINDKKIVLLHVYTSSHSGESTDHSGVWAACENCRSCNKTKSRLYPDQTLCIDSLIFRSNRLRVYASEDKHAIYPTEKLCEDVILVGPNIGEDCGGGITFGKSSLPVFHVGANGSNSRLIDHLDDHPVLGDIFPGEAVWSSNRFCGGLSCDSNSPHSIGTNLNPPARLLNKINNCDVTTPPPPPPPPAHECIFDTDCGGLNKCVNNQCVRGCRNNFDCLGEGECFNGVCYRL